MDEATKLLRETGTMAQGMGLIEPEFDGVREELELAVKKAVGILKARKHRLQILEGVQDRKLKVSCKAFKGPHTLRFKGERAFLEGDGNTYILKAHGKGFLFDAWGAQAVRFGHRDDKHNIAVWVNLQEEEGEGRFVGKFEVLKGKGRGLKPMEVKSE